MHLTIHQNHQGLQALKLQAVTRTTIALLGAMMVLASASAASGETPGAGMSVVNSITENFWNEEGLTAAEKSNAAKALVKALESPGVVKALDATAEAREAYLQERKKLPAERSRQVAKDFLGAKKRATEALRAAILQADPSLEQTMGRRNEGENASDSEQGNKKAITAVVDIPELPRVLLIGDSISIGYTTLVRSKLQGKANVHRVPVNARNTEVGVTNMKSWLGAGKWDVIHFNFGLHDAKYASPTEQRTSRGQYAANLQQLIDQMRATGATLIFATTTPVPDELQYGKATGDRVFDSIPDRNAIATDLMKKNHVAVNDLYTLVLPKQDEIRRPADVHFTSEGYELLADAVAGSIGKHLQAKKD